MRKYQTPDADTPPEGVQASRWQSLLGVFHLMAWGGAISESRGYWPLAAAVVVVFSLGA